MTAEVLANIDAALSPHARAQRVMSAHASVWAMSTAEVLAVIDALAAARVEIVRLAAHSPTPDPHRADYDGRFRCSICNQLLSLDGQSQWVHDDAGLDDADGGAA